MKRYLLLFALALSLSLYGQKEYYELRTYSIPFNGSEQALHDYFEDALLPALIAVVLRILEYLRP
jgi:uncharacterized lipoprotein YehR (DUF1307 family)